MSGPLAPSSVRQRSYESFLRKMVHLVLPFFYLPLLSLQCPLLLLAWWLWCVVVGHNGEKYTIIIGTRRWALIMAGDGFLWKITKVFVILQIRLGQKQIVAELSDSTNDCYQLHQVKLEFLTKDALSHYQLTKSTLDCDPWVWQPEVENLLCSVWLRIKVWNQEVRCNGICWISY